MVMNRRILSLIHGRMIHRTLVDFLKLHSLLNFRHLQGRLPTIPNFPSQWHYAFEKARSYAPSLPLTHQDLLSRDFRKSRAISMRRRAIENYLWEVLAACNMRVCNELCTFLELSTSTLEKDIGYKGKEGYVKQRSGVKRVPKCSFMTYPTWNWKWFIIRSSYFALFESIEQRVPSEVFLLDEFTEVCRLHRNVDIHSSIHPSIHQVKRVVSRSRNPLKRNTLILSNESKRLKIRLDSERQLDEWFQDIIKVLEANRWLAPHRFGSFAPIRNKGFVKAFLDGEEYFGAAANAIENAKDTIYIQGWWLTPELFLKRPPALYPEYRLDRLLRKKAEEGVQIFIIVYKEVSYALGINSLYTKNVLSGLHPNIRVLRFPDHAPGGTLYWALHDKLVVVDNVQAFVGGLDLCMGRFDNDKHSVGDSVGAYEVWPGMDYSNPVC